jgi:hypothetical protein
MISWIHPYMPLIYAGNIGLGIYNTIQGLRQRRSPQPQRRTYGTIYLICGLTLSLSSLILYLYSLES